MRNTTIILAAALVGCGTTGVGDGVLERDGKPEEGGDVAFTWRADPNATEGSIHAVLPDGRAFDGRFMQVHSSVVREDLGPYWSSWAAPSYSEGTTYHDASFDRVYSGRMVAQLRGPEGQRMRCVFQLARPEEGPEAGGAGRCQLSTGERIEYAELREED
ncbi:hypothetical protein [Sandaracinus amylolyticus]|uniref:hypothetical protein n=1 Tax=Sandaracinus amylolyticus TaxID=927083 RepID=UPI001F388E33|nr:hypothetical protein [Sandaracinus amylolyticus]UJR87201.1 Hypothetical protein I5071_93020 [Sandaracinus amylolyticus]